VVVAASTGDVDTTLDRVRDVLTIGALVAAVLGAIAALALSRRALRPLRELTEGAALVETTGDPARRLAAAPAGGEVRRLTDTLNSMLAALEAASESERRFVADASHELRTPLSIIKANTNLALEHPWPAERYREFLAAIDTAAGRQSRIVEELLFLARADAGGLARDVGPVCLLEVLEEAAEAVAGPGQDCVRIGGVDPALLVRGSGSELTRLFTNLLQNAVRHTPPPGTVTVVAVTDAQSVVVTVTDTGEGIAPEHLPHLGERFYRVDAARAADKGSVGLGLAICRSIIEAHGGEMTIESQVGAGTTVRIRLPLCPPRP
jgi:signal transduction histidine kinase